MKYVYMLQIDWAKDNKGAVYTTLFERYEDAMDLLEEEIVRIREDEGFIIYEDNPSEQNPPWKTIVLFPNNELYDENDNLKKNMKSSKNIKTIPITPNYLTIFKIKTITVIIFSLTLQKLKSWRNKSK